MNDQIHNYSEPHFCRVFKDMDLLFLQFIGTLQDTSLYLNQIIYRYSLQNFLFGVSIIENTLDMNSTHQLLEGMLLLLINTVTELPLPPSENPSDRIRIMLRREIVHFLISGPCPYSDLQNLMQVCVPESERTNSSVLDDVISAIGDWQEGTSMEPSKVKLKEKSWLEYDSSFPHAAHRAHQKAHENRPKIKSAQPYAPPPPPSHPQFTCFRHSLLTNPILWDIIRTIMVSFLSVREKTFRSHDFKKFREMNCPISVFTMSLHLLTLVVHCLFSSENIQVNLLELEEKFLNLETRRNIFSDFLNEKIGDLCRLDMTIEDTKIPSFLDILIDLYEYFASDDDPTKHWIFWIIGKITELSSLCDAVVGDRLRQQLEEKRAQELLERRNRARERAMQSMKKSAAAFESHIGNEPDDLIEEEEDATNGCVLECIVCRSSDNEDTLGYIGYSQASKYLHHHASPSLHMVSTPEISMVDLHVQVMALWS